MVGSSPMKCGVWRRQGNTRFPYGLKADNGELGTRLLCFRRRRAHRVGKAAKEKAAGGGWVLTREVRRAAQARQHQVPLRA